jgi:hypothetical protein
VADITEFDTLLDVNHLEKTTLKIAEQSIHFFGQFSLDFSRPFFLLPFSYYTTFSRWVAVDTTESALISHRFQSPTTINHPSESTHPPTYTNTQTFHFFNPNSTSPTPHSWAEAATTVPACKKDAAATTD